MRNLTLFTLCFYFIISCSDDEKTIDIVTQNTTRGAILRTLETHYAEFHPGDLSSKFEIDIEEQDLNDGELLSNVEVFLAFIDNTPDNGIIATQEMKYQQLEKEDFEVSNNNLPLTKIRISFNDALNFLALNEEQVLCKDQFTVRLQLNLIDGRSFTFGNNSSIIIASDTFFTSPFLYFINVVEPIEEDLFTGIYNMEDIVKSARMSNVPLQYNQDFSIFFNVDGSYNETTLFEVQKGHSANTRFITGYYNNGYPTVERARKFEFTIACDEIIFQAHQFSSYRSACSNADPIILLGPSETNGISSSNDDTVFELRVQEGYLGFDGGCGFGEHEAIVSLSKQ
jgi:hypothetical protein